MSALGHTCAGGGLRVHMRVLIFTQPAARARTEQHSDKDLPAWCRSVHVFKLYTPNPPERFGGQGRHAVPGRHHMAANILGRLRTAPHSACEVSVAL